jgi:O-antigen/teichoic acid export membrane protein
VLPGYSKIAGDPLAIRQGFLNVLSVIALCAVPAGSGIALVADSMVIVVLGEKWREVIPLIQILAVSGVIGALQTNVGSVYMVLGKVRFITIIAFFHTLFLFLPLLIVFLQHNGVMGVAKAYLYSNLIVWPLNYFVVLRLVKIRLLSILAIFWRPFLACGFMIFAVMYGKEIAYFYQIDSEKILLFVEIFIGAITYGTSILLLWWVSRCPDGAERFILSKLTLFFTR